MILAQCVLLIILSNNSMTPSKNGSTQLVVSLNFQMVGRQQFGIYDHEVVGVRNMDRLIAMARAGEDVPNMNEWPPDYFGESK
jgi:hypothetical protein